MYKAWTKNFFAVFLISLMIIVSVNIIADPMYVLPFMQILKNRTAKHINVAHQKTNFLYFSNYYKIKDYDGIIFGSSRSVPINSNLFLPEYTVFNYTIPGSRPNEVISYLSFAQELHGSPLRLIVIGLDFFASSGTKSKSHAKGIPVVYTQEVKKTFYTLANLINLHGFYLSLQMIKSNLLAKKPKTESNSTISDHLAPERFQKKLNDTLKTYDYVYSTFTYNPDYKQTLQEIKEAFPNAKFMVFTTPVSKPHLEMMFEYGLKESYKQWLTDIVDVFDNVTHFMDENEVTINYDKYFRDSHHLYPDATDLIVKRITHKNEKDVPADFGRVLTKENLPEYLKTIK